MIITNKQTLIIVAATFITIVLWVVFDILHSRATVTPNPQAQSMTEPITPTFNIKGLEGQ